MKTAISLPDPIFHAAERLCARHQIPRSRFYAMAIKRLVDDFEQKDVTARLNEIYRDEPSEADPAILRAQFDILDNEKW